MDKKNLIIAIAALFIVVLLAVGAYYLYSSIQRELESTNSKLDITSSELDKTKSELSKSQEDNRDLNSRLTEIKNGADDIKTQLVEAKKVLDDTQEENRGLNLKLTKIEKESSDLKAQLTEVKNELNELNKEKETSENPIKTTEPAVSPVAFDTNTAATTKETGVAQGPSGQALDGMSYNGPTWTDGIRGRALVFNGTNQFISLGNVLQDSYGNFSIACWIKHPVAPSGDPSRSNWQNIIERSVWDDPDGLGLIMDGSGQSVDFGHYNNFVQSKANVQDDRWHYIVGTMAPEGGSYIFSIYVDGVLDNTHISTVSLEATKNPWSIGARYNGSWFYQGLIEDVRLYDSTLSATEIQELFMGLNQNSDS